MRSIRRALLLAAFTLPLAAAAQQLTVSTAASLTDAFKELAPKFEAARPGVTLRLNFGASGVLLQQISQGAPVDVFASADQDTMNRAAEQKAIDPESRRNFVSNALVLIEPAKEALGLKSLHDLTGTAVRKIALGKPATVPAGRYTREVLEGAKLWPALEPRFVYADNVRQVLDYVARGEVEAGFVYRTDAALMPDRVRIALTPAGQTLVTYPIALVSDSRQKALAREFIAFVLSEPAQQVLARYGFGKP